MTTESKAALRRKKRIRKRRIRQGIRIILLLLLCLLLVFVGIWLYQNRKKPYTVGIDAGHGGQDTGAIGYLQEVALTEQTADFLEKRLEKDGRFRVIRSRKNGETVSITDRKIVFQKKEPDIILSIHGNSDPTGTARGFECFPSPPGRANHESSYTLALLLAEEMAKVGNQLRGINGVRYGYYIPDDTGETKKVIKETSDDTVYDYPSFGILEDMSFPAVLAEQCFVTNMEDIAAFGSEKGCQLSAEVYYQAICRYLQIEPMVEE